MTSSSRYGSSASALAPIMVGLRIPDPDAAMLRHCWRVATLSVPETRLPRFAPPLPGGPRPLPGPRLGARPARPEAVVRTELLEGQRRHTMVTTADSVFVQLAKLVEVEPYEPSWASLRWRWLVGARAVEPRRFGDPFTRCSSIYRIETLSYRLRNGVLAQAPQLALFRHVLVTGLRALHPELVVTGGQHHWRDEWWAGASG